MSSNSFDLKNESSVIFPPTMSNSANSRHCSVAQEILCEVKSHFSNDYRENSTDPLEDKFIEQQFFDLDYLKTHQEIERKWVNKPFAYVSVLRAQDEDTYQYHVTEPILTEFEQYIRQDLTRVLRNELMYQDLSDTDDRESVFRNKSRAVIADYATGTVDAGSIQKVQYYITRDFVNLGSIDPVMRDPAIEDISCDGDDIPLYVYHFDYHDLETNIVFDERELRSLTLKLAQRAGEHVSYSEPLRDGSLPDGSRVQLTFGSDISPRGPNFTVRKFSQNPITPVDLIKWNTFSVDQMTYFWLALENNKSLIFSGGTASGKTTSMNAVSLFIPVNSKVVSIEDTREVTLPHDNWIQSVTRDSLTEEGRGEITMFELLRTALRQRPEYIIVGEIRTEPKVAFTFFQAIGTGHTACTTIHSESMMGVLNRLQNPPLEIPIQMLLDLDIVSIQKQTYENGKRVRRNQQVTELLPSSGHEAGVQALDVFTRNPKTDTVTQVNESHVMDSIAAERGWDNSELKQELNVRKEILQYLVEKNIADYNDVARTFQSFFTNRDGLLQRIRSDSKVSGYETKVQ